MAELRGGSAAQQLASALELPTVWQMLTAIIGGYVAMAGAVIAAARFFGGY